MLIEVVVEVLVEPLELLKEAEVDVLIEVVVEVLEKPGPLED